MLINKAKRNIKFLVLAASLGTTLPTFAAEGAGNVELLIQYLSQVVNATVNAAANLIYQINPDMPNAIAANLGQMTGKSDAANAAKQLSLNSITNTLTPQPNSTAALEMASIPASDTLYVPSNVWSLSGQSDDPQLQNGNNNFNFSSLIEPLAYSSDTQTYASNFIKFLSGAWVPASTLDLSGLNSDERKTLQSSEQYQSYQLSLRSAAAQQSVSYTLLYYLYAERQVQKGLGTLVGMLDSKNVLVPDASPLQVEKYMATRRANNVSWYGKLATASPTTILREIAIELAEIEKQQFELHMDNERALATLAAIDLQGTANSGGQMSQDEDAIKQMITQMTNPPSTGS